MTQEQYRRREQLAKAVKSVITTVMPGATVMDMPSALSDQAVAVTAFDAADTRTAEHLFDAFIAQLTADGWVVDERERQAAEPSVLAAKSGLGGGAFSCRTAAVSFNGLPEVD